MVDVTIIGGGSQARDCGEVLSRAGFSLAHSFEVETGNRSPIILGEVAGAFQLAREAVADGRHILIAGAQVLSPERLSVLLEERRNAQAIFLWNDRRYHPGYRFLTGLMETDHTWRPRYLRMDSLSTEAPSSALSRWHGLETLALLNSITASDPQGVNATSVINKKRNAPDLISLNVLYRDLDAFLTVGLGEPFERRETLLAAPDRKAFVDELNQSAPIRIIDDEPTRPNSARWLACSAPSAEELARQQCIAFLDSTLHADRTQDEAAIWQRSLATLEAMDRSLAASGANVGVVLKQEPSRFRIVGGLQTTPPSVA